MPKWCVESYPSSLYKFEKTRFWHFVIISGRGQGGPNPCLIVHTRFLLLKLSLLGRYFRITLHYCMCECEPMCDSTCEPMCDSTWDLFACAVLDIYIVHAAHIGSGMGSSGSIPSAWPPPWWCKAELG